MKLFIASDHGGFLFKKQLIEKTQGLKINDELLQWEDLGCDDETSVDYPDWAEKLCKHLKNEDDKGVLVCNSGQGMAIKANRFNHIRAALCANEELARLSIEHNKANVLCLGSCFISLDEGVKTLKAFLTASFQGGRHQRRVDKI